MWNFRARSFFKLTSSLLLILVTGCSHSLKGVVIVNDLGADRWAYENPVVLTYENNDTGDEKQLNLMIRHLDNLKWDRLKLEVTVVRPDSVYWTDTVSIQLAHDDGSWIGKKMVSQVEISQPVREKIRFDKNGSYHFILRQLMNENPLEDIVSVGIHIQ